LNEAVLNANPDHKGIITSLERGKGKLKSLSNMLNSREDDDGEDTEFRRL